MIASQNHRHDDEGVELESVVVSYTFFLSLSALFGELHRFLSDLTR